MRKIWNVSIAGAAIIAVTGMFSAFSVSSAEDFFKCDRQGDLDCPCASPDAGEALPPLPAGCHKERITAAGEQTLGIVRSADYLARKAWQRQAIEKYGERFQRWDVAACRAVECGPGSIAGYKRCTYSAFACSPDVDVRALADLKRGGGGGGFDQAGPQREEYYERNRAERVGGRELEYQEIVELQRLLNRAGYPIAIDGQFGEATSEALIRWQRRAGVPEDGQPTFHNLEELRRRLG
jgi:hypothetical protein